MRRYELTDDQWELIAGLFPSQRGRGRRFRDSQLCPTWEAARTRATVLPPTLKHARRIATRHEETAVNFLAMLKLAMIQRYFRIHLRDTT